MTEFEVTGVAQHQAWAEQAMPPVERLAHGLWSIPVPIPNSPLRYVLVYGFELPDGIAIVDAGWPTDDAWDALVAGLGQAGFAVGDVRAVLVTHIHPDHYGLAGRVREASGAWVAMHPADAALLDQRYTSVDGLLAAQRSLMAATGVPDDELPGLSNASMGIREAVSVVRPDLLVEDGDQLDLPGWRLQAIWTPGHSPGHLCFHEVDRRLLLSGDHVLPRITPNISAHPQQRENPLADFLDALAKVEHLDVGEVLPAHEYRFRGLAARVGDLVRHHHERLAEIEAVLQEQPGATTWEVTLRLTWSRPWDAIPPYMRRAANGETLAHLLVLAGDGRIVGKGETPVHWHRTG